MKFMDHSAYLKRLFAELEHLRPVPGWACPHALTCNAEGFHILLSLGDARVNLRFDEMDADPIKMAEAAIALWRTTPDDELPTVE